LPFLRHLKPFKKLLASFEMNDTDPQKIQTPDWISGSAMMTTKEALNKVGPMDESFFFYFEDVDWSKRFWQNGYKVVYFPGAQIYHALGRGSKTSNWIKDLLFNKKAHWHIKSAIKFFLKHRKKVIPYV